MLNDDELAQLAEKIEADMHDKIEARRTEKRKHWPRRVLLVVVVLVVGYGTHRMLEIPELSAAAQSFELVLASLIDSIYARVKE